MYNVHVHVGQLHVNVSCVHVHVCQMHAQVHVHVSTKYNVPVPDIARVYKIHEYLHEFSGSSR